MAVFPAAAESQAAHRGFSRKNLSGFPQYRRQASAAPGAIPPVLAARTEKFRQAMDLAARWRVTGGVGPPP
jgi:hypothetical protein